MHHIIYLSHAILPFTDVQLQQLLTLARQRNEELGITGILLYGNQYFVQVLEGGEREVLELYELIRCDSRHEDVTAYADKPISQRAFKQWAMAFQPTSPQQSVALAGYLGPTDTPVDTTSLPSLDGQLFDLLRSFTLP